MKYLQIKINIFVRLDTYCWSERVESLAPLTESMSTLTRHFLSMLVQTTVGTSSSQIMLTKLLSVVLLASQVRSNAINCPAFEPFRCPEEQRCISIQVRGWRWSGNDSAGSISVTELPTVPMVTTRTPGSAQPPGGRRWRRPPASWSLCWPLTAPTTWRSCSVRKPETTCNSSEEWITWL